jgi:hypothetical protein
MSVAADVLRQFWLPAINEVSGHVEHGFDNWLRSGTYQIYEPISVDRFTLNIRDTKGAVPAFAADATRMAAAGFESWHVIGRNTELPKSTGWLVIKAYYAAFFAAHSLTRMLGRSVTFVDRRTADSVYRVAEVFGTAAVPSIRAGLYECAYDSRTGRIVCGQLGEGAGGAHEAFWREFGRLLGEIGAKALEEGGGVAGTRQAVVGKLDEVAANLNDDGRLRGTWLSEVRNQVNYRQEFGAWHPYGETNRYYEALFGVMGCWKDDPMTVNLRIGQGRVLQRYVATCGFILALCRSVVCDMESRCPRGRSFHTNVAGSLLNLVRAR